MSFCLPFSQADKFLTKLKSGEIDPAKLAEMTSDERRTFFKDLVGEHSAREVNALFESKLLLKNQQQGMINWAKQIAGLKPEVQRDILAKVNRMTEVLQPKEMDAFLEDLAAHKLGVTVSASEAAKIADLAKATEEAKAAMQTGGDRMAYGRAKVQFSNYVSDLKNEAGKLSLKERIMQPGKALSDVGGVAKSIKASFDNSAIFRQGWKTMWTNPQIWLKNARQSFLDLAHSVGGKTVMDEVNADIVSRPNYDLMKQAKLAVGNVEETYPSSLPEKVPVLGRAYKASEEAFTAFVYRTRADVFDKYIDIAKKAGVDVTDRTQLEGIGKLVNSLTGRGHLGAFEPAADGFNNIFFSARALKAHIDVLTAHAADLKMTAFAKKQAAMNLVKIIGGTAAVLATANAVKPGSVQKDPRSSDFGKIKIGHTRFDVSGGMASIVTLAARLLTMSSKSTTTGQVTKLNSGKFGAQTGTDVVYSFLENKLSPIAGVIRDLLKGQDFQGKKPTLKGEASNLFMPLPVTNYLELKNDPQSANKLLAIIADALGIGTNTYAPPAKKK
jgi:hypothetical protein